MWQPIVREILADAVAQLERLERAGGHRRALRQVLELLVDLVHQRDRELEDAVVRLGRRARPVGERLRARRERRIERELGGLEDRVVDGPAVARAAAARVARHHVPARAGVVAQLARDVAPRLARARRGQRLRADAGLEVGDDVELVVHLRMREHLARVAPRVDRLADAARKLDARVRMRRHDERPRAHLLRRGIARTQVREVVRAFDLGVVAVARDVLHAQPAHGRRDRRLGDRLVFGDVVEGAVDVDGRRDVVVVEARIGTWRLSLRLRLRLRLALAAAADALGRIVGSRAVPRLALRLPLHLRLALPARLLLRRREPLRLLRLRRRPRPVGWRRRLHRIAHCHTV